MRYIRTFHLFDVSSRSVSGLSIFFVFLIRRWGCFFSKTTVSSDPNIPKPKVIEMDSMRFKLCISLGMDQDSPCSWGFSTFVTGQFGSDF